MELLAVGPARAGFRADGCVRQKGKDGLAQRRHGAVAARLQPRADGAAVPAGDEALQLLPALVLNGDLADLAVRAEQHAHEHKRRFRRSLCGLYVRCAQTLRRETALIRPMEAAMATAMSRMAQQSLAAFFCMIFASFDKMPPV